jgi:hypothetical protein
VHLLERPSGDTSRHPGSDRHVERVEEQADDLGLELVAPRAEVVRVLGSLVARDIARENRCASLATYFGVPASCFADVVRAAEVRPPTSFISQVVAHLRTVNHGKPV